MEEIMGVEDPIVEYRCNICGWAESQPELHKYFMGLVAEGKPPGTITRIVAEYIVNTGLTIKPPLKKSVWTHYNEHLRADVKTAALVMRGTTDMRESADGGTIEVISSLSARRVNDYEEMCRLYTEIEQRCHTIYGNDDSLKLIKEGVDTGWAQNKIQTYMMMINTRRSILAEIAKMRQSEHVIKIATQFVMERFTESLVHKLIGEFAGVGEQLKRAGVAKDMLKAFDEATSKRLAEIIMSEADSAMELTRKEFKIQ